MKNLFIAVISIICLFICGSCTEKKHSIVGTWKLSAVETPSEHYDKVLMTTKCEVVFRPNGTAKITLWDVDGKITDLVDAQYTMDDTHLVITGNKIQTYPFKYRFQSDDFIVIFKEQNYTITATFTSSDPK